MQSIVNNQTKLLYRKFVR